MLVTGNLSSGGIWVEFMGGFEVNLGFLEKTFLF
jgi:hypothetical protein